MSVSFCVPSCVLCTVCVATPVGKCVWVGAGVSLPSFLVVFQGREQLVEFFLLVVSFYGGAAISSTGAAATFSICPTTPWSASRGGGGCRWQSRECAERRAASRRARGRIQRRGGNRQIVKASSNVIKMRDSVTTPAITVMGSDGGLEP